MHDSTPRPAIRAGDYEYGLKELATWGNNGGHGALLDAGQATLEIFDERLLAPEGIQLTLFAPDEGS